MDNMNLVSFTNKSSHSFASTTTATQEGGKEKEQLKRTLTVITVAVCDAKQN
jgi:hypothetical protein